MLFFRFFTRSYRTRPSKHSAPRKIQQSGYDATRDVKEKLKDSTALGNGNEDMDPPSDIKAKLAAAKERVKSAEAALGDKASAISNKAGELYEQGKDHLQKATSGDADGSLDTSNNDTDDKKDSVGTNSHPVEVDGDYVEEDDVDETEVLDSNQQEDPSKEQEEDRVEEEKPEEPETETADAPKNEGHDESEEQSASNLKDENAVDAKVEDVDSSLVDLGDAQAYEATIDEVKDEADDQAEKELQPEGL